MTALASYEIGDRVALPQRLMSRERMRWYCDALETAAAADGEFRTAEPTIHTDDEYARSQGLPGIIADGMISTNWISSLLFTTFGVDYLRGGSLRTKFVRPVYEDERIATLAEVTDARTEPEGRRYELKVWCENADAELCTVGTATVTVRNR